jgi:hypothetical protein
MRSELSSLITPQEYHASPGYLLSMLDRQAATQTDFEWHKTEQGKLVVLLFKLTCQETDAQMVLKMLKSLSLTSVKRPM